MTMIDKEIKKSLLKFVERNNIINHFVLEDTIATIVIGEGEDLFTIDYDSRSGLYSMRKGIGFSTTFTPKKKIENYTIEELTDIFNSKFTESEIYKNRLKKEALLVTMNLKNDLKKILTDEEYHNMMSLDVNIFNKNNDTNDDIVFTFSLSLNYKGFNLANSTFIYSIYGVKYSKENINSVIDVAKNSLVQFKNMYNPTSK